MMASPGVSQTRQGCETLCTEMSVHAECVHRRAPRGAFCSGESSKEERWVMSRKLRCVSPGLAEGKVVVS